MSVVKANKSLPNIPEEEKKFYKSPTNLLFDDLKQHKPVISGASDTHTIPANSSGIIKINVNCDYEFIPCICVTCNDVLNGINACIIPSDVKNIICVCIENLINDNRDVKINYVLNRV